MKMEVSFGDLTFQVVVQLVLIASLQEIVSGEIAQGCVGSRLSLSCPEMKVIGVTSVVLGVSGCYGTSCCIRDYDCSQNAKYTTAVHNTCDGQSNCTVNVFQEVINCGYQGSRTQNDFERITYNCRPRDNPQTEVAQGCVGSRLSLRCSQTKVINVTSVVLGDSACFGSSCCITDNDCSQNANANHTMNVHSRCDGKSICMVDVLQERINCGSLVGLSNSDFERITYDCLDGPRNYVSSAILGIVGAVCLIITIGIAASVCVVKVRRKRMNQLRSTEAAKTVDDETDGYETIDVNGAQGISIETTVSEYCELDAVDRGRVQRDSHYLQLNKRQQVKSTDEAKKVDRETDLKEVIDINGAQRSSLETAATAYCELHTVPTEGVARESVQCGSEYLQLYE